MWEGDVVSDSPFFLVIAVLSFESLRFHQT